MDTTEYHAWHTTSSQGMSDVIHFLSSLKLVVVGIIGVAVVIVVNSAKSHRVSSQAGLESNPSAAAYPGLLQAPKESLCRL